MKKKDYIPAKDAEFDIWQGNLISIAVINEVPWNILTADLDAVKALKDIWTAAWTAAKVKETRTSTQVKAKNVARFNYKAGLRTFVQQWIQNNPLVTDANKISMGIKPKDGSKSPVPVPASIPQLDLLSGNGNSVRSFFRQAPDESGVSSRGKPSGVAYCEVAFVVSATAPVSEADFTERRNPTRSPFTINSDFTQAGKRLYAMARWVNTKGQVGQWSAIHNTVIPG